MAEGKNIKNSGTKQNKQNNQNNSNPVRETQTAGGSIDYTELITGEISIIGEALASSLASFYVGKTTQGNLKKLKSIAEQSKEKSILGQNSIYSILSELKGYFLGKEFNAFIEILNNIKTNTNDINDTFKLLTENPEEILKNISFNIENKVDLSDIDLSKIDLSKINLSQIDLSQIDLSKLDLSKINIENKKENKENQLNTNVIIDLSILNDYIKTNQDIILSNSELLKSNSILIRNISDLFNRITSIINSLQELSNNFRNTTKSYYETTTNNLFKIIQDLRNEKTQEILEAKLKLTIEGFDSNSIQSLIDFGNINFDQAGINGENFIDFLYELEDLQSIELGDAKEKLDKLSDILNPLLTNTEKIKDISKKINETEMENLFGIVDSIKNIMITLNKFPNKIKADVGTIVKLFGNLNIILTAMLYSIPLIVLVNKLFKKESRIGVNLETTSNIIAEFGELFEKINSEKSNITNMNLLKSLVKLDLILGSMLYSIPLIVLVNKSFKKIINLTNTKNSIEKFEELFQYINEITVIDSNKGDEVINSLKLLGKINTSLLKNFAKIKIVNKLNPDIIESINRLSDLFDQLKALNNKINGSDIRQIEEGVVSLQNIIFIIKDLKTDKSINNNLEDIANLLFGRNGENGNSLEKIFKNLKENINGSIDISVIDNVNLGVLGIKDIIDTINDLQSSVKDPSKLQEGLDEYLKILEDSYNKIKEKFEQIITTGDLADKVKEANKSIQEVIDDNNETIIKTSSKQKDIDKANISMDGMTAFMISAAVVMSIGALFVMLGGGKFVKASLQFGVSLAIFEGLVLLPALMFFNQKENALFGIKSFNSFVVTCAMTMIVGAIVYSLGGGKLVKNALAFGITLSAFEILIVSPILLFCKSEKDLLKGINDFKNFVITTTVIMLIGALAVQLLGGKMIINAMKFGIALMTFEFLIVLPFILFGKLESKIFDYAKAFSSLVIICTTVMIIGALFTMLGGGKFIKAAYEFGKALMIFEIMVIAPFILFNLIKKEIFDGVKAFSSVLVICTTVLLIGALFMTLGGGKFVKAAMQFTVLLMGFEIAVILPFLLFNLIKRPIMSGLRSFAIVLMSMTTVLMIGALFMTIKGGQYPVKALLFAGLLDAFVVAVVAPMLLFNIVKKIALNGAKDFGIFVVACSFALIVGAFFIVNYGVKPVLQFGAVLSGFVFITTIAMTIFSAKSKMLVNSAAQFGLFVFLSSAALVIGAVFINKYSSKPVIEYGILLTSFVVLMSGVMVGLAFAFKAAGGEQVVMSQMIALGGFLICSTTALLLGAWFINTYGAGPVLEYGILLIGFIGLMGLVFVGLTYLAPFIAPGAVCAGLMGTALLLLTGSIMLINLMFKSDPKGKQTIANINVLDNVLDNLKGTFAMLGLLGILIAPGAVVATLIGVSILVLGGSLSLINLLIGKHGEELKTNIGALNELLGLSYLAGTYTILGLLLPLITLGSVAGIAMGISIMSIGGSLALVNSLINPIKDEIIPNIEIMQSAIFQLGLLSGELLLLTIPLALAMPAIALMNSLCLGLTASTLMIGISMKKMSEIGDMTTQSELIVNNLKAFIDIPDKVISSKDLLIRIPKLCIKLAAIAGLAIPISHTMLVIGRSIQELANLKVATVWDKNGNPIKWRQLNDNDFGIAQRNIGKILYTLADAFVYAWNGGEIDGIQYQGLKNIAKYGINNPIWCTLNFGKEIGYVIKGIAEGVGAMAKMQIPIAWDNKGNPIAFRQLKDKDFDLASRGTQKVLTHLVGTIASLYQEGKPGGIFNKTDLANGKNIFDLASSGNWFSDPKPGPFESTLITTMKLGELIGNISTSISDIARMQIPIAWDNSGKPTSYRTLKTKDFQNAADNVSIVLTTIIACLADLYKKGETDEFGGSRNKNIFDIVSGGLFSSDDPAPIIRVIEASLKVSELISNIGKGIKDIATMMIPDAWNDKGHPIHYVKLTKKDFTDAGESVGEIITCVMKALTSESIIKELRPGNLKDTLEAMLPISELISGMADGIIKLASGQVPDEWDPKTGKPIHYTKITAEDYILSGLTIGTIMSHMINTIQSVAYEKQADGSKSLMEIFEGDTFKNIVEAISSTGSLISNIADSVVKIGKGMIPDNWDKDGKAIHYKTIDYTSAISNLKSVVKEILMATVESVIEAYNGKNADGSDGIKSIIGTSDDSPFMLAVQGISQIIQTVSSVTDAVVKLGQAQIPNKWDKDGKPVQWEKINITDTISNIKKIFLGDTSNEGIFTILCKSILDVYDEYFKEGNKNNLTEVIPSVTNSLEQIIKTVSNTANLLVKIGSLSLPTGFDNEGKPIGIHIIKPTDITKAKENINLILKSLLSIFDKDDPNNELKDYLNGTKRIDQTIINDNIMNAGGIINTLIQQVKTITTFNETITELYKYNPKTAKNEIQVGLIRDIYTILDSFISLSNKVIDNKDKFKGTQEEYNLIDTNLGYITDLSSSIITYVAEISNTIKSANINELNKFIRKEDKNSINNLISNILSVYNDVYGKLFITTSGLLSPINNDSFITLKTNLRTLNNIILLMINSIDKNIEAFNEINNLNTYTNQDSNSYIPNIINKILSTYLVIDNIIFTSGLISNRDIQNINNIIDNTLSINYLISYLVDKIQTLMNIITFEDITQFNEYVSESVIQNRTGNIMNIFNNIDKLISDNNIYSELKDDPKNNILILSNLTNNINNIYSFVSFLVNEYYSIKNILESVNNIIDLETVKSLVTFYSNSFELINNIYTTSFNNGLNNNSQNLMAMNLQIMQISRLLSLMFSNMGTIYDTFYRNVNNFKANIDSIIGQLDMSGSSLYTSIEALKTNLDAMRNIYKTDFADIDFKDENNVIHNISDDLQYFVNNAINPFDQEMFTKFNNLNSSINTIYKTISQQKSGSKEFRINTNELGNYIKVINSVQLNKLQPLTTLVKELNKLANQLGGLDKLTDHLTNELAVVLKELVDALNESKGTISDAHKLQKDRHDQINKSINTIKGLLNMPLNVNIQASGQDMALSNYPDESEETPNSSPRTSTLQRSTSETGISPTKTNSGETTNIDQAKARTTKKS